MGYGKKWLKKFFERIFSLIFRKYGINFMNLEWLSRPLVFSKNFLGDTKGFRSKANIKYF